MATEFDDSRDWAFFIRDGKTLTNGNGFANRWSEQVLAALRSGGALDNMEDGTTPPATDKFWLDKNSDPAVLKEWDSIGSAWVPMTFDRLFGRAVVTELTNVGGTANAITVDAPATFIDNRLYTLTPTADNTGATTIQVAGVGTFSAKYHDGTDVGAKEFVSGQSKPLLFTNGRFEVIFPVSALYIATAAAQAAADAAVAAASTVVSTQSSRTYAAASYHPAVAPDFIETAGYAAAGDLGDGVYRKGTGPTGDLAITLSDGSTNVGYDLVKKFLVPQMFGASGDDATDNATAINATLAAAAGYTIYMSAGIYRITDYLRVRANTRIIMDPNCIIKPDPSLIDHAFFVFLNGEYANDTYATGYDGDGNIEIIGGVIDGALCVAAERSINPIAFSHGRRIRIGGITIKNNWESHPIEINACEDVIVTRCHFEDHKTDPAAPSGTHEFVNIDGAYETPGGDRGFYGFGSYDNTPCKDVRVFNNTGKNGIAGVGSHALNSNDGGTTIGYHENINVFDNSFANLSAVGIRAQGWRKGRVERNALDGCGSESILIYDSTRVSADDNQITHPRQGTAGSAISVSGSAAAGSHYCAVRNNQIEADTNMQYALRVTNQASNTILQSAGAEAGSSGLISDAGVLTDVNGKTKLWSGSQNATGTLTLSDSLANYDEIMILSGSPSDGSLVASVVLPWGANAEGFRTGDDFTTQGNSGKTVWTIASLTSLTITTYADLIRYVYGTRRKV
jgi:hypothetical protein